MSSFRSNAGPTPYISEVLEINSYDPDAISSITARSTRNRRLNHTPTKEENTKGISATEYIRTNFNSSDRLAILVRNRNRGETVQRITTSARIVEPAFQEWMHFKNEKELCDIYVGMNTLKPEARTSEQRRHPDHSPSLCGYS